MVFLSRMLFTAVNIKELSCYYYIEDSKLGKYQRLDDILQSYKRNPYLAKYGTRKRLIVRSKQCEKNHHDWYLETGTSRTISPIWKIQGMNNFYLADLKNDGDDRLLLLYYDNERAIIYVLDCDSSANSKRKVIEKLLQGDTLEYINSYKKIDNVLNTDVLDTMSI